MNAVAVTADGKLAVLASDDHTLKVWDLDCGHALQTLEGHLESVRAVAATEDRRAISGSADNTVKIWDLESGRTLRTLEDDSSHVSGVAVMADG